MAPTQPELPVRGARLFAGDAIIILRLLNERRHRIMAAVFGVSRENSNLVTLFAIGASATGIRRAFAASGRHVRRIRSSPTRVGDTMIGGAVAKETVDSIAGHPARDAPSAAALIAFAVAVHSLRPAAQRSLHAARQSLRRLAAAAQSLKGISLPTMRRPPRRPPAPVGEDRAQ
jgi:hypothetical protein